MQHLPSPVNYREDINGLRAWAVIAVLLFHFQLPGLGAGFMGVDIFFVISGFLMTAIIIKGLVRDNFSILKFYMARARRILPALLVVIVFLLSLGWFYLPTFDYTVLANQSLSALFFVSNIYFGLEGSYFSNSPYEKWLLHTWSLAVEAQFYVLFPIFLIIVWKIRPRISTVLWGLIALFFISLALNIVVSSWKPTIAFYVLPTRAWELAAGGLAFLIGREFVSLQRFAEPFFWGGFSLFAIALIVLDSSYAWPSGWALLPVLGTVLIILAQQSQAKLTVNPIAQWLGDRSYSLYLWHWPFVVGLNFAGLQHDLTWLSGAIVLSFVFAHFSYHFIEVPTRSYLSARSLRKEVVLIGFAVMLFVGFSFFVKTSSIENRIDPLVDMIAGEAGNYNPKREACQPNIMGLNSPGCVFGESKIGAYLIGDSHSDMVATTFGEAAKNYGLGIQFFGRMGCPTIEGVEIGLSSRAACTNFNNWLFEFLEKDSSSLPIVVVNSIWHEANHTPRVSFDYARGGG
ncbi:MAG: acyltransferase [Gammaproteobacteria bacterium]|nr:acyltransferase [Gammaproteobacteria bacterium]